MYNQTKQQETTPNGNTRCKPCDLTDVDGLACTAKRYQKQAEVMTQVAIDLKAFQTQEHDSRKAYGIAWEAATAEFVLIQAELEKIGDLLACRLEPEQRTCLDDAATNLSDELDEGSPTPECRVTNCEFDDTIADDDDAATLADRIAAYRRTTEANTAEFRSLVGEAAELTARVATIKTEVAALAAEVTGTDSSKVLRRYARFLVAARSLQLTHIGHGFTSIKKYVDCTCTTLQCIVAGWAAIVILEGAREELACIENAKKAAYEEKTRGAVDAILVAYECCIENSQADNSTQANSLYDNSGPDDSENSKDGSKARTVPEDQTAPGHPKNTADPRFARRPN